jgi:hypothetical protein
MHAFPHRRHATTRSRAPVDFDHALEAATHHAEGSARCTAESRVTGEKGWRSQDNCGHSFPLEGIRLLTVDEYGDAVSRSAIQNPEHFSDPLACTGLQASKNLPRMSKINNCVLHSKRL